MTYTQFSLRDLKISGGETITATFTVKNIGDREGADVPQLYLTEAPDGKRLRLLGFERVVLKPGESHEVKVIADPRFLLHFDLKAGAWRMVGGIYNVALGESAGKFELEGTTLLNARVFGK